MPIYIRQNKRLFRHRHTRETITQQFTQTKTLFFFSNSPMNTVYARSQRCICILTRANTNCFKHISTRTPTSFHLFFLMFSSLFGIFAKWKCFEKIQNSVETCSQRVIFFSCLLGCHIFCYFLLLFDWILFFKYLHSLSRKFQ